MIMYELYILFFKVCDTGKFFRISLVGGELLPYYLFRARPFRVPAKEPPAKNSVKIVCLTNYDQALPELAG